MQVGRPSFCLIHVPVCISAQMNITLWIQSCSRLEKLLVVVAKLLVVEITSSNY